MTALIYKAALPTYTSAAALTADAGETLLLNGAGTAYELLPGSSGGYVPGTDRMLVESDYETTQTIVAFAPRVFTTLTFYTPEVDIGDSFELGTKGIKVLAGTLFAGDVIVNVDSPPAADTYLYWRLYEITTDGGPVAGTPLYKGGGVLLTAGALHTPWLKLPFLVGPVTPGRWLCASFSSQMSDLVVSSLGMDIRRIA